jgi:hypothetical protein
LLGVASLLWLTTAELDDLPMEIVIAPVVAVAGPFLPPSFAAVFIEVAVVGFLACCFIMFLSPLKNASTSLACRDLIRSDFVAIPANGFLSVRDIFI